MGVFERYQTVWVGLGILAGDLVYFVFAVFGLAAIATWFGAVFVMLTGLGLFELARRQFAHDWGEIQTDIEKEIKRRETAA